MEALIKLRNTGFKGGDIQQHRAFRTLPISVMSVLLFVLMTVFFMGVFALMYPSLLRSWQQVCQFWFEHLDINAQAVRVARHQLADFQFQLLAVLAPGREITLLDWLSNILVLLILFAISFLLPTVAVPIKYLLRGLILLHSLSLVFFAFAAPLFPYAIVDHTRDIFTFTAFLIFLTPAIFAVTFYIFETSWLRMLSGTAITMFYFIVSLPFTLVIHTIFIQTLSPLSIPVLYLLLGPLLQVILLISLYSWIVSWHLVAPDYLEDKRRHKKNHAISV